MPIEKVISGGQTGADQAAWRAAKRFGLATGGWMPKGFLTEDGPRPGYAELYGAREHEFAWYPPRTRANVRDSDATVVFDRMTKNSPGTTLALNAAGNRESSSPGIGQWVEEYLCEAFRLMGFKEAQR